MEKIKTLSVDLFKPSANEEYIFRVDKTSTQGKITSYRYDSGTKYKTYLNIYGRLESGIPYRTQHDNITIWVKNGKLELEDEFYFHTFDRIEAEEKSLEIKKKNIAERKDREDAEAQELYDELKAKYGDRDWFK